MRLLDRYLLREFLVPFAYCISGFLIFWIAFDLFSELHTMQDKHLLAGDIAEYYLFRIPEFLPVALPVALLLALLYAITNHTRHNELTAMRTAGLSLWRLCAPYLAVGLLGCAALFALNEFCAPRTAEAAEQVLQRRLPRHPGHDEPHQIRNLAFKNSREDRFWGPIGVYNLVTGEMTQPHVEWRLADGSWRSIFADRAVRTNGVWTFYHVREFKATTATNSLPVPMPEMDELAVPRVLRDTRRNQKRDQYPGSLRASHPNPPGGCPHCRNPELPAPASGAGTGGESVALNKTPRAICRAVHLPGGRDDRRAVRFGVRAPQRLRRGGRQHLHLFRVFPHPTVRLCPRRSGTRARLAGGVDAQFGVRDRRRCNDVQGPVTRGVRRR